MMTNPLWRGVLIKQYLAYKDFHARYKYIISSISNMFLFECLIALIKYLNKNILEIINLLLLIIQYNNT